MVLCQILSVIVSVALLCILNVDAELRQVTIIVVFVFVVDNGVPIAIVLVFAAAACCCLLLLLSPSKVDDDNEPSSGSSDSSTAWWPVAGWG